MALACNVCKKTSLQANIKRCAKCSSTPYCSRECQKADWKEHKKICGKTTTPGARLAASGTGTSSRSTVAFSPPKGLERGISCPFTQLDRKTWLHNRPETDVYRLLIDSYRLRVEDDYNIDGEVDDDSLYSGADSGIVSFKRYLGVVQSKPGLLPTWWTPEKSLACEQLGMDRSQWSDLHNAVTKSDIIEQYGDSQFPMQLRMFAEHIRGRAPGGADGASMRQMLVAMEQRNLPPGTMVTSIDNTTGNVTEHKP
ncbi:putative MYND domain protein [Ilyonectria sp. MPI-CAGE-AT-0026]|nr:putative MYND domain protein [Ilyonectria sp. MPI-CAGE-AT-0026]